MTDKEILRKAITKASLNDIHFEQWLDNLDLLKLEYNEHFGTIFSHRFAKEFWENGTDLREGRQTPKGTRRYFYYNEATNEEGEWVLPKWKQCLKEMVLEKNPLTYLEKFL